MCQYCGGTGLCYYFLITALYWCYKKIKLTLGKKRKGVKNEK